MFWLKPYVFACDPLAKANGNDRMRSQDEEVNDHALLLFIALPFMGRIKNWNWGFIQMFYSTCRYYKLIRRLKTVSFRAIARNLIRPTYLLCISV